jgi:excinuclease ABC subunit A
MILAPLVRERKGEHQAILKDLQKAGFVRVRIDGQIHDLSEEFQLDKNKKHTVEVVVDRLQIEQNENVTRLADSIETALKLGSGVVLVKVLDGEESLFSEHFACVYCGISLGEIAPRTFSFNNPYGACPACTGLGCKLEIDPNLVIPDKELSLAEGAIQPWMRNGQLSTWSSSILESLSRRHGFSLSIPVKDLSEEQLRVILYGDGGERIPATYEDRYGELRQYYTDFAGVIPYLERRYRETSSDSVRADIERYMASNPCPTCQGKRLKPESLAVTIVDKNIMDVTALPVAEALS